MRLVQAASAAAAAAAASSYQQQYSTAISSDLRGINWLAATMTTIEDK